MELQFRFQIENCLNNSVDKENSRKLDSISIIGAYCYMKSNVFEHHGFRFCYRCCVKIELQDLIIERNVQHFLMVINSSN